MRDYNKDVKEKLLKLMNEMVNRDKELREKYKIGEKFRFIHDRLEALRHRVEENFTASQKQQEKAQTEILEDEVAIYVYIYNTQGVVVQSWQKLLNPAVFYEYSVNRPIYEDKSLIESFIKRKANPSQHGYLTIIVKKDDIIKSSETESAKDSLGNPLIKVKEGTLHPNKFISFSHLEQEYILEENGELVVKKK